MIQEGWLLRFDVVDQSIDLSVRQFVPECGHQRTSELYAYFDVLPARFAMAEGQFFVFEQMIEARSEFWRMILIVGNVVTDCAVLAI